MKQPSLSVCLAGVLAGSAVALFSFSCSGAPTPHARALTLDVSRDTSQAEPKKTADPIVVSADTLAQAVQDDINSAVKKYHLTELQVDGVVAKQSEYKGKVGMFQFELEVKDRKANKMVGFTVFCSLKDPLKKGDKKIDEFAVGKKVTVRGKSTAMGNGQVTLTGCVVIVAKGDKGGAKKGSASP